jgi:UTP:GlnB (protein PII) uridylyltransferase
MEDPGVKTPADKQKQSTNISRHIQRMDPSYETVFSRQDIRKHTTLAHKLSMQNLVEVDAVPLEDDFWRVTIVAYDYPGELAVICGLMFVYRLNIYDGNVFTYEADRLSGSDDGNFKIVDVFKVKSTHPRDLEPVCRRSGAVINQYAVWFSAGSPYQPCQTFGCLPGRHTRRYYAAISD